MRKPIKPFAVETRRIGRKPPSSPGIVMPRDDEAPRSPQPEWPPLREDDADSYGAAMRAADALFSRPAPAPEPGPFEGGSAVSSSASFAEPPRRILQSLNEDDHISRLLAEEAEHRPRRGRKPREAGEAAPARAPRVTISVDAPAPAPELVLAGQGPVLARPGPVSAGVISGYVRGEIYARYARHDQARPGEQWRKRGLKPLW